MSVLLYGLLTWTTRSRADLIDAAGAAFLRQFLPAAARRCGADVLALGVLRDHLHVLLQLPPTLDIPRLVQHLKGSASRIANRDRVLGDVRLRWADGYDLRSISPRAIPRVMRYVEQQGTRHPGRAV